MLCQPQSQQCLWSLLWSFSPFPFRIFWALLKVSKNSTPMLHQTKTPFRWRGFCIIPADAIGAGSESTEEFMNSSVVLFCYCWGAKQTSAIVLPAASNFRGFKYNARYADLHLQILLLCPFYSVSGSRPCYSFFLFKCYFSSNLFDILGSSIFVFTEKHVNNFIYWCCTMCLLDIQVAVEYIPRPLLGLFKW